MVPMKPLALVTLLLLLSPSIQAQDPVPVPTADDLQFLGNATRPILDPIVATTVDGAEFLLGEDLTTEDIRIGVDLNATNAEVQLFGMLFGGGKVQVDFQVDAYLEFRAVNVKRLDQALEAATGDQNITLNGTFGVPTYRLALTAEEVRLIGAGFLLQAFQDYEIAKATEFLTNLLPGLRVVELEATWSHTTPLTWLPGPGSKVNFEIPTIPLREPPIRLDVTGQFEYLTRLGLYETLMGVDFGNRTPPDAREEWLKETQQLPPLERPAFQTLGYGQYLNFSLPEPWRLEVTMRVPKGFSVEHATDEMAVTSGKDTATFTVDASRSGNSELAAIVTASNRGLITWSLLGVATFLGIVSRAIIEVTSTRAMARVQKWTNRDDQPRK